MDDTRDLLSKPASKLKMVECKTLLKCRDAEWLEMGAILLEITKEFELSSTSWSDQKYEAATSAALSRIPMLKTYLARIDKDDRYRYELVKRMITVKAKKQTELAMKRKHRSSTTSGHRKTHSRSLQPDTISVDSGSQSPDVEPPTSPRKSSPVQPFSHEPRRNERLIPKPFQHGRSAEPYSPQTTHSGPTDISDIFLSQTRQYISAYRTLQDTLMERDGQIYALQGKVMELERELERYRRLGTQTNGVDLRRPFRHH